MPNECSNHLTVTGPAADVTTFVDAVEGKESICDALLPMPEELRGTTVRSNSDDVQAALTEKYGAPDWYGWAKKNWGTKWGDYNTDLLSHDDGCAVFSFTTAWGPMDKAIESISALYPTLTFESVYEESGNVLLGVFIMRAGECTAHAHAELNEFPDYNEDDPDTYAEDMADLRDRLISEAAEVL